jgi:hypothetical protein
MGKSSLRLRLGLVEIRGIELWLLVQMIGGMLVDIGMLLFRIGA